MHSPRLAHSSFGTSRLQLPVPARAEARRWRAEGAPLKPCLRAHLDGLGRAAALVFTSPDGQPLRHSNFYRRAWMPALATTGLVGTHLHDLRHTGNQFIADAGANPRELMARMGHDSARAALIYLHSSAERQRALANEVGRTARAALSQPGEKSKRSGTRKARNRQKAS
jgi:integrase